MISTLRNFTTPASLAPGAYCSAMYPLLNFFARRLPAASTKPNGPPGQHAGLCRRRDAEAVDALLAGGCKIRGRVAGGAQSARYVPETPLRHGGRRGPVPVHGKLRM